jgi:cob(I)alamin adenosyltransferase
MKIYTKTGDSGETGLLGGARLKKNEPEICALGDVDELNAAIGIVRSLAPDADTALADVQRTLFAIGATVASVQVEKPLAFPELSPEAVRTLEVWIDDMEKHLQPLSVFILPGGSAAAAQSFLARAVCRRAERSVSALRERYGSLSALPQQYLNRLSDALFVLGRWLNARQGRTEIPWRPR